MKDDYSIPKSRPQQRRREPSSEDSGPDPSPPPRLNNVTRDKLAADDAEIEALEKALGVKGKKKLPQLFEDDGLDGLLDGLGDGLDEDTNDRKRRRDEGDEWLEAKRKKTRKSDRDAKIIGIASSSESDEEEGEFGVDASSAGGEGDDGPSSERSDEDPSATQFPRKTARENPYRAPGTSSAVAAPKYVPPSLRNQASSETEDLSRLRRQIQGLINRLSEANMLSILGDIESLYRTNARQHVSSTLLDILIGLLCDPSPLHDTFVILHAGFIVALYKTIGPDFGAQAVQRFDGEFRLYYEMAPDDMRKGKKVVNLTSLMSQLYTFQLISSNLIYDYIKLFAKDLSEETAELLLKCVRSRFPVIQ